MTERPVDPAAQVIADARGEAAVLRRNGHAEQADTIERLCDAFSHAAEEYLTWLSEGEARIRSGRSVDWLRGMFPQWERQGHARKRGKAREYRMLIIPQRPNLAAAYEAGRQAS